MPSIIMIVIIIVLFVVAASLMEWKADKDKRLYECYTKMIFESRASASGCTGKGMPQCQHCYYHKVYLKKGGL